MLDFMRIMVEGINLFLIFFYSAIIIDLVASCLYWKAFLDILGDLVGFVYGRVFG